MDLRAMPRILLGVVAVAAAVPLTAAASLMVVDRFRKRRSVPGRFPVSEPKTLGDHEHEITVYTYGQHVYDAMLAEIDQARETVYLETFIWKGDETGQRFKDALLRAAERGVRVYASYDTFANLVVDPRFYRVRDGFHLRRHPMVYGGIAAFLPRNLGRDHNKLLIVDSRTAFIGGYNIGHLYATQWRDTHARIRGPYAKELENTFADYFSQFPVPAPGTPTTKEHLPESKGRLWGGPLRVQRNIPPFSLLPIRSMYMEAIDRAQEQCWITQAYFVPDGWFIHVLLDAAQRGVDVRILVPAKSNHVLADWLSRGFYDQLLAGGVRIFRYQNAMIHAKTATIDDAWCTIGTANLDRLSLAGNFEVNVEIFDPAVATTVADIFRQDLDNAEELTLETWRQRSVIARGTEQLLTPLRSFV